MTYELQQLAPDAFFVDQLSAGLPLLQLLQPVAGVFFYCHFPDLHLAQGRAASLAKRVWRLPFDALEGWSMGYADTVAVNSDFTKGVVAQTWPRLAETRDLRTVYPCVPALNSSSGSATSNKKKGGNKEEEEEEGDAKEEDTSAPLWNGKRFILSINRFERKKEIDLAIRAFASAITKSNSSSNTKDDKKDKPRLVIAGGYDPRIQENVTHHNELIQLATSPPLSLKALTASTLPTALHQVPEDVDVLFILSAPALLKHLLLRDARCLAYTPSGEHFGIVPLEAMLECTPVLAANRGGPVETVVDGVTGWLRGAGDVDGWAEVMGEVLYPSSSSSSLSKEKELSSLEEMGKRGRERVLGKFSEEHMAEVLDQILDEMVDTKKKNRRAGGGEEEGGSLAMLLLFIVLMGSVAGVLWYGGSFIPEQSKNPMYGGVKYEEYSASVVRARETAAAAAAAAAADGMKEEL